MTGPTFVLLGRHWVNVDRLDYIYEQADGTASLKIGGAREWLTLSMTPAEVMALITSLHD